MLTFSAGVGL